MAGVAVALLAERLKNRLCGDKNAMKDTIWAMDTIPLYRRQMLIALVNGMNKDYVCTVRNFLINMDALYSQHTLRAERINKATNTFNKQMQGRGVDLRIYVCNSKAKRAEEKLLFLCKEKGNKDVDTTIQAN